MILLDIEISITASLSMYVILSQADLHVEDIKTPIQIQDREAYAYLLKMHHAIACCDKTFKTFVVQDFDYQKKQVKVRTHLSRYI